MASILLAPLDPISCSEVPRQSTKRREVAQIANQELIVMIHSKRESGEHFLESVLMIQIIKILFEDLVLFGRFQNVYMYV